MLSRRKERQHYIPRFYLDQFTVTSGESRGVLWMYDTDTDHWIRTGPKDAAVQRGFYAVVDKEGNEYGDLESFLQETENRAASIYHNVIADRSSLSTAERLDLAYFMGVMFIRVPGMISTVRDGLRQFGMATMDVTYRRFKDDPQGFQRYKRKIAGNDGEEAFGKLSVEHLDPSLWKLTPGKGPTLAMAFEMAESAARGIFNRGWIFMHTDQSQPFITSDAPVSMLNEKLKTIGGYGHGFGHTGTVVTFPFSQHICLRAVTSQFGDKHVDVGSLEVLRANKTIMHRATRYLFSPTMDFLGVDLIATVERKPPVEIHILPGKVEMPESNNPDALGDLHFHLERDPDKIREISSE